MAGNQTMITEFILLGFPLGPRTQVCLFGLFLLFYTLTLLGNGIILGLIWLDSRLHTPMYFFLSHLAVVDIAYACNTVPQMLANLLNPARPISFAGCLTQTFLVLTFAHTECLLLVLMSYDRYVAICQPLRYSAIMSWRVCVTLAVTSWMLGVFLALVHLVLLLPLPFCGPQKVHHFFCEIRAVLKLACKDTHINEVMVLGRGSLCASGTLFCNCGILHSYSVGHPIDTVRGGAPESLFHLLLPPQCGWAFLWHSHYYVCWAPTWECKGEKKYLLLFHSLFNPMLNPMIYSLRNKEVKVALKRMLGNERTS